MANFAEENFDKIQKSLFSEDESELEKLSERDKRIRQRYLVGFTAWLDNPTYTDKQMLNFITRQFGVTARQAFRDLGVIKVMLGNVRNSGKEWYRHVVIQMCQEAYNLAKKRNDAKAMALAADKLGKYTRCDQLEAEALPWDQIIPPSFEPSADISILGFKTDPDIERKRAKLRKKYSRDIEDAVLIDVLSNGNQP